MDKKRMRVTQRQGKFVGILNLVVGCCFVLLGIFVVIPSAGAFGVFWTAAAIAITGYNTYRAFSKRYMGPEICVEMDGTPAGDVKSRLQQLEDLYNSALISYDEYERKRKDILDSL